MLLAFVEFTLWRHLLHASAWQEPSHEQHRIKAHRDPHKRDVLDVRMNEVPIQVQPILPCLQLQRDPAVQARDRAPHELGTDGGMMQQQSMLHHGEVQSSITASQLRRSQVSYRGSKKRNEEEKPVQ